MAKQSLRKYKFILSLILALLTGLPGRVQAQDTLIHLVNPFIGTGGHGHTYPGATMPFGMVQLSPDTRLEGWDGCSGYHYSDSIVYGFSHTHLSGTGVSDYGDILLMPFMGELTFENGAKDVDKGYASRFDHAKEQAYPGYYAVHLDDPDVDVELTATERAGMHHYVFNVKDDTARVMLDLGHRDKSIESDVQIVDEYTVKGMRRSRAWAQDQYIFFYLKFSRPIASHVINLPDSLRGESGRFEAQDLKVVFNFAPEAMGDLNIRIGISAVDESGAMKNLDQEIPSWDFEKVLTNAKDSWEKELGRIRVSGGSRDEQVNFYTALYHSFICPNLFSDVDGRYRGTDLSIHQLPAGEKHYTIFSLWDTFRALHPLFTIVQRERTGGFIRSMLRHYTDGGQLPVWELAGNYTGCMIGYHTVSVIFDAWRKGIRDFDGKLALRAMDDIAMKKHPEESSYWKKGYVDAAELAESVSKTLEYAYDDWCIALMADAQGRDGKAKDYELRALNYRNVYDDRTGFMRPRLNGGFIRPFDPHEVNFHYTEANSWQYSLFAPQDVQGMMALLGGPEALGDWLDELFDAESSTTGREQADITGLIGQYAHGNEPSHHMAYLYNFAGRPYRTQEIVSRIMQEMYSPRPDGLSGNEDCGQMSAWYVMSAMGMYPVTPGEEYYVLGKPLFDRMELHLENGKTFVIRTEGENGPKKYVQQVRWRGIDWPFSYLFHSAIAGGEELVFVMGDKAEGWSQTAAPPEREIKNRDFLPLPYIEAEANPFEEFTMVTIGCANTEAKTRYRIITDGDESEWVLYTSPIRVSGDHIRVEAYAETLTGARSQTETAEFRRYPNSYVVELLYPYSSQYPASGGRALVDGMLGGDDFRTGAWQGYQSDFAAKIDLGEVLDVDSVGLRFLQDQRSWIWMPTDMTVSISKDGRRWKEVGSLQSEVAADEMSVVVREYRIRGGGEARYLKVEAQNLGQCPAWHPGAGGQAWIFTDEVRIWTSEE